MSDIIGKILSILKAKRFDLADEKKLQEQMYQALKEAMPGIEVKRECSLDNQNRIDFLIGTVGIEVKIKGSKREIYKQCERYCALDAIGDLILVTNKSMGLPSQINGKNCFILKLGVAWL